jgi:hypothetical protein
MTTRSAAFRNVVGTALIALGAFAQAAGAQQPRQLAASSAMTSPAPAGALGALFTPAPTPKVCGPFCADYAGGTTLTEQGSGSSCANAEASLTSQLKNISSNDCAQNQTGFGSCNFVVTYTTACTNPAPGTYQRQGYATYNCKDTSC